MQTPLNTRVKVETFKKLDEFVKENDTSKAAVVDQAINEFLEKKVREDEAV